MFDIIIKLYMAAFGARMFLPNISSITDNPIQRGLYTVTEPVLGVLRQFVPKGRQGFDWSPFVAILLLVVIRGILFSTLAGVPASTGVLQSGLDLANFLVGFLAVLFLGVFFISINSPFGISLIGQMMITVSDPLLNPLRRIFGRGRSDHAALIGIVALALIHGFLLYQLADLLGGMGGMVNSVTAFIWFSFRDLLGTVLDAIFYMIIIRAISSWFQPDPSSPIMQIIILYSDPILEPIRNIMPGGTIDISPLIAILIISFIRNNLLPLLSQI